MNTDKTAARIVKGLVTIRNAVAKLDTAHVNGRSYEAQSALNTIDDEYFFIRECLDELVEQTHYSVKCQSRQLWPSAAEQRREPYVRVRCSTLARCCRQI